MRRLLTLAAVVAGGAIFAAVAFGSSGPGSSTARFDVIFDDARGLVAGQLVEVAGARAGTINNVVLTSDFKARIEANVDSRFMPFHRDATCAIRPQGLIAENYVDCDPGTANSPPLHGAQGKPPTVPVTNTTEPVSLLDLFNIFNLPTRQRFMVLVDELGIGTAARGQNLNDILLRANPALELTRKAISILANQRAELSTIVGATNTIAAEGAGHTGDLQSFLDRAAGLTTLTASHSSSISESIQRLPGLLAVAQPALHQLDTVAVQGTPLVSQIHAAVPFLNRVETDLGPFVATARPGLAKLSSALSKAIPAIRDTTPLVQTLRAYAAKSLPGTLQFAQLSKNLVRRGFVENFLSVPYYVGAALARFDSISHMLPLLLVAPDNGMCGNYATTPVPGCSAHYGSQPAYRPSSTDAQGAAGAQDAGGPSGAQSASGPSGAQAGPGLPPDEQALARRLLLKALHGSKKAANAELSQLQLAAQGSGRPASAQNLQSLIDYLLK